MGKLEKSVQKAFTEMTQLRKANEYLTLKVQHQELELMEKTRSLDIFENENIWLATENKKLNENLQEVNFHLTKFH